MRTLYFLVVVLFLLGCKNKLNTPIFFKGVWNAHYIFYENKDILDNYNRDAMLASSLSINKEGWFIIQTFNKEDIIGFMIFEEFEKDSSFIIEKCSDARLNGKFSVINYKKKIKSNGRYINYYANFVSEKINIVVEKKVTDFSVKSN